MKANCPPTIHLLSHGWVVTVYTLHPTLEGRNGAGYDVHSLLSGRTGGGGGGGVEGGCRMHTKPIPVFICIEIDNKLSISYLE